MLFSKTVYQQKETVKYKFLCARKDDQKLLRTAFLRYFSALNAAELVFDDATEAERDYYEEIKAAADKTFSATVTPAEAAYNALMATLAEGYEDLSSKDRALRDAARTSAHEAHMLVLRNANNAYDKSVCSPASVLKAVEKPAMAVYEHESKLAYDEFNRELANLATSEPRSACDDGCPRFVFQEAS